MKILKVSMTQAEYQKIFSYLSQDPCTMIDCEMTCENCPFNEITDRVNDTRNDFLQLLGKVVEVERDEG